MGGFNFIFCVAENFIKTVGFDFIVSNANDFIKNSESSTLSTKNIKTSFLYPTDRKSLVQRTGDFQFYSPNGEFYCFAVIYGFQPSDIALRQLKRRIEYHCDEVAISLLP